MTRLIRWVPALFLAQACLLVVPEVAYAQVDAVESTAAPVSLDEARQLTWRRETRSQGVAALRRLSADHPEAADARFELGRVLTWNASTRAEGVALLRRVTGDEAAWGEAEEALAEVLAWDGATRDEAIARFRRLVEREPMRVSARLKLADVLSWSAVTREESESLYREILQADGSSVPATVGLARVLSWRGRFAESRFLYESALTREPGDASAWIGLVELDAWKGRGRAALATLSAFPEAVVETPEALRLRAQAYSQIGRPARALDEYDALLTLEASNQTTLDAARSLRARLRPVLEVGADGSGESGDAATSRVRATSVPLRFSFHPGGTDAEVSLLASQAFYRNSGGLSRDTSIGAGVDTPLGNHVRLSIEAAGHEFDRGRREITGRAQVRFAPNDRFDVRVGAARDQLSSSRLSLGGEEIGGIHYGPSFADEAFVGVTVQPGRAWDLWAQGTRGRIRGVNIDRNDRQEAFAGVGRTFRLGDTTIRPGYAMTWMSYDLDLSGFPSTDLGGNGVTTPGVGGYFSPFRFLNQMVRLDATFPVGDAVLLVAGAGVGQQQVEDTGARDFSTRTTSSDGYFGVRLAAGDRVSIRGQINYQDVASAFDRTVVQLSLAYGF